MENILHDFNENVISLMTEFLKNSIIEGGLSNFTDDLNDRLMKLGYDLTKFALEYAEEIIFNLKERKTEFESLEKDDVNLKEIFSFKQKGLTKSGEVNGSYIMYKYMPKVYNKIKSKGIDEIDDIFEKIK